MNNTTWHYSVNLTPKSFGITCIWNMRNYINSKRTTKSAIGDLVTRDNYGNTVIEQTTEVLGSYFQEYLPKKITSRMTLET